MPTNNPWLNPYQRSYDSIKEKLKATIRERIPEITDFSEGNIFMILVSIFAAIAEVIHYYIDNLARESFFVSARRYSSLYKHAKLVDYHIKCANPASVDLTMYTSDGNTLGTSFTIPTGTTFVASDGKRFVVTAPAGIYWDKTLNPKSIKVPVVQKETTSVVSLGQITNPNVAIPVTGIPSGKQYVEGSMIMAINGTYWTLVDTFAYYKSNDKVFKVELDGNLQPQIIFGDGTFGQLPSLNGEITIQYEVTYGAEGNLAKNTITTIPSITGVDTSNISVNNFIACSGGTDYENFAMLKEHIPLSVKTLGVAITKEDFEAVAKNIPGVNKAYAEYFCGKQLNLYITPDNGEITASQALLDAVSSQISVSKVITTAVSVLPVYKANIYIDAEIYGKKSFSAIDIRSQIVEALDGQYGLDDADLGRAVRVSDIYALIDNLPTVDYLNINKMYLLPSPVILSSEGETVSPDLLITSFNQYYWNESLGSDHKCDIYVEILENDPNYDFSLNIEDEVYQGVFGIELDVDGDYARFKVTISEGELTYNPGDRYYFYVGPMNTNLEVTSDEQQDSTSDQARFHYIPIFQDGSDTLILYIHEQV